MSYVKLAVPIIFACLFNAVANTFWKYEFTQKPFEFNSISKIIQTFFSLNIIVGILFYIGSMLLFFYMLSNFKLSVIIPLTSLTYIFNLLAAYFIFHENVHTNNIIGTIIIIVGIAVLSQASIVDKV